MDPVWIIEDQIRPDLLTGLVSSIMNLNRNKFYLCESTFQIIEECMFACLDTIWFPNNH